MNAKVQSSFSDYPRQFYSPREVADQLKVSVGSVYKALAKGHLQCYRIGKTIRITEQQLTEFLDCAISSGNVLKSPSRRLKHL